MKIIVNQKKETICYVQLRDLIYLANQKRNAFRELACKYMDEFKDMTDFVRVTDPEMVKIIKNREDIIDFDAFSLHTVEALTRLMVAKNLFSDSDESKRRVFHETQAIQDLISYKKGELEYNIPLIADDRIESNINGYYVTSSNSDNKFIVKCDHEIFPDFVHVIDIVQTIAKEKGLLSNDVEYSYKLTELDNCVVLSYIPVVKKKEGFIRKLFKKKRTDN